MQLKPKFISLKAENRLHQCSLPIIGLTGGIATGKSTVSRLLGEKGFYIIDADQLIKEIYTFEETHHFLNDNFPGVILKNEINFKKLRSLAFQDPKIRKTLEDYLYAYMPKVFTQKVMDCPHSFLLYDVPLLFEKNLAPLVDQKVLVYATREIQKSRLIKRDQSSSEEAESILKAQINIDEKKGLSNFIIENTKDLDSLEQNVDLFIKQIVN
jgi:dephospho-CoA kinase